MRFLQGVDLSEQISSLWQTQVYIDTTTIGSTADNNIQSVEWTLNNGWSRLNTHNGTVGPQSVLRPSPRTWTLRLRRYYANTPERTAWNAGTERKIRVLSTGPTLGGSTYKLTADFYTVIKNVTQTFVDDLVFEEIELVQCYRHDGHDRLRLDGHLRRHVLHRLTPTPHGPGAAIASRRPPTKEAT